MISYFLFWILDQRTFSVAGINLQTELTCLWYKRASCWVKLFQQPAGGQIRTAAAGAFGSHRPDDGLWASHTCSAYPVCPLPPPGW